MEDSLNVRFDEVEQELIKLLSLRADDLQIFSSRQDQLLQSHYHSLSSALQTAQIQLERIKSGSGALNRQEIRERWIERQNLKKFWVYCEELQRQNIKEFSENADQISTNNNNSNLNSSVYQTPNQNDSNTNLSTTSLSTLQDLSLD